MTFPIIVVHSFPSDKRITLIKLIREWTGMGLCDAKNLTDHVPFQFAIERPPLGQITEDLRKSLTTIRVSFEDRQSVFEVCEEDMVKAMVIADDQQTGAERCRYMLRAALGTISNEGLKLVRIRESGAGIYYSANG